MTTCIFVQQPCLADYKAHALRPFFNLDLVRMTKLRVLEVNEGELINGVVSKMWSEGAKIRLSLIQTRALEGRLIAEVKD